MKTATKFLTLALSLSLSCVLWAQQGNSTSSTNNTRSSDQHSSTPARPHPQPAPSTPPQVQPLVRPQPQVHTNPPAASTGRSNTPKYLGRGVANSDAPLTSQQHHPGNHGERPRQYSGYSYYSYPVYVPAYQPTSDDPNGATYAEADNAPAEQSPGHYEPPYQEAYVPAAGPATPEDATPPATPSVDVSQIQTPNAPNTPAEADNTAILVFKNGAKLEVKGFIIYAGNVIVLTGEVRRIPLDSLDLPATMAANEEAGYTFRLPAVYRD